MGIQMYTTSTCGVCKSAKEYFEREGIEYQEINIEENADAATTMMNSTGVMSVPQFYVEDKWIVGWNKQMMLELLNQEEDDFLMGVSAYSGSVEVCESCEG